MRNGGKKDLEPYAPAYLDLIKLRCDDLRKIATKALQALPMQDIEESEQDNKEREPSERENLELAQGWLGSIDALAKFIDTPRPSRIQRAHAPVHLWKAIGAVAIICSRGMENPFLKDKTAQSAAKARNGRKRIRDRDKIQEVVDRHGAGSKNLKRINTELEMMGIDPLTKTALYHRAPKKKPR